jgi:hypothetical protein
MRLRKRSARPRSYGGPSPVDRHANQSDKTGCPHTQQQPGPCAYARSRYGAGGVRNVPGSPLPRSPSRQVQPLGLRCEPQGPARGDPRGMDGRPKFDRKPRRRRHERAAERSRQNARWKDGRQRLVETGKRLPISLRLQLVPTRHRTAPCLLASGNRNSKVFVVSSTSTAAETSRLTQTSVGLGGNSASGKRNPSNVNASATPAYCNAALEPHFAFACALFRLFEISSSMFERHSQSLADRNAARPPANVSLSVGSSLRTVR